MYVVRDSGLEHDLLEIKMLKLKRLSSEAAKA